MRVLHTSDWHLGRLFHGESLLDDQAVVLDRLVDIVRAENVELVVIAGDLYDRAIPPAAANELFGEVLACLTAAGARIAAITGNHDSAGRVGGTDLLLNRFGVAVRGDHRRVDEPLVIDEPADGGPPVAVYLIPYLEPAAVAPDLDREPELGDGEAADHEGSDEAGGRRRRHTQDRVVRAATARIRRHLDGLHGARSIVVAHTFAAGGSVSDSERDLNVGFVDRVGLDAFDGFDLVALGHLHRPQQFDGGRIAYAGSILPYSFSEEGDTKSVRIVDLLPDGSVGEQRIVPLEPPRPVRTLRGTLEQLLADPDLADAEGALVRIELADRHLPDHAKRRLEQRFAHVLEFQHDVERADDGRADILGVETLRGLEPVDLVLRFWNDTVGREPDDDEREVLLEALDAVRAAER